ncbi:MAG TPA: TIR domain-containing protein, partial [Zoogloea sp.]|nr:TIR domain-containing protein [Zoogloea sp.]
VDSPVYLALPDLHPAERVRPRIFISYAHAYGRFVRPLAAALQALDLEVNRDVDLVQGGNWAEDLAALLDRADLIVCVIGRDTALSTFQMAEIQRALASGKPVVPVLVEPLYGTSDTLIPLISRPCANRDDRGQRLYLANVEPDALPSILQRTAVRIRAALDAPAPAEPVALRLLTVRGNEAGKMHYLLDESGRREWTRNLQHDFITLFRDVMREHPANLPKMLEFITNPLLPLDFAALPPARRYQLLLDTGAAAYPWELILALHQNGLSAPLPAIRRPDGNLFSIRRSAPRPAALLIGNPSSDGTYGDENPRLPPPEQGELFERYRRTLESRGLSVSVSMGESARGVVEHLYARDIGILLISGTYLHDYRLDNGRTASGFVLSDGMFLSVEELRLMRSLPDLVILDDPATGSRAFGAEMAPALLKAGVTCVVISAWGVERRLAGHYFETLLAAVGAGEPFAGAHAGAIQACATADPASLAWGAFQAWGDAEFRLTPPAA